MQLGSPTNLLAPGRGRSSRGRLRAPGPLAAARERPFRRRARRHYRQRRLLGPGDAGGHRRDPRRHRHGAAAVGVEAVQPPGPGRGRRHRPRYLPEHDGEGRSAQPPRVGAGGAVAPPQRHARQPRRPRLLRRQPHPPLAAVHRHAGANRNRQPRRQGARPHAGRLRCRSGARPGRTHPRRQQEPRQGRHRRQRRRGLRHHGRSESRRAGLEGRRHLHGRRRYGPGGDPPGPRWHQRPDTDEGRCLRAAGDHPPERGRLAGAGPRRQRPLFASRGLRLHRPTSSACATTSTASSSRR